MKNFLSKYSLPLLWIFSFLVIIFMITQTVHAEEEPTYPLYIDTEMNPSDVSIDTIKNAFNDMWGDLPQSYIIYCGVKDTFYFNGSHGWDYYDYYTFYVSVDTVFEYPLTLDVNSSYYYITNTIEYQIDYLPDISSVTNYQLNYNMRRQYAYYYMAQGLGYVLFGTEENYTSTSDVIVWAHRHSGPVINVGSAVVPPPFIVPEYLTGESPPTNVPPSYTINNYTWTTAPSFDNSSVISGIQSIKDTLDWFADNIKNAISNLLSNIKGLAEYIGKTIQYYGNAIIETINNAIQNFYDNMASLVQPIFEKVAYITEPLDVQSVSASFVSTNTYAIYDDFTSFFTTVDNVFNGVSEPDSLIIPIHLEQISTFYNFGIRSPVYLDLEQFENIRSPLRAFCWVFASFGAIFLTENQLSMWLQGGSSSSASTTKGGG